MLETDRNKECLLFKSDKYEVYHVKETDYNCDLHIIGSTPGKKNQLLIPVDKNFMIKNLKYFENMFKAESNWEENKHDINSSSIQAQVANIEVSDPEYLGEYIKSMYTGKLDIDNGNCADFYAIADFFQDESLIQEISDFIKNNITFINSIKLINYSDKFENEIEKFYESNDNFLSDIYQFMAELIITVIDPNKFIKIMKILKLVVSSEKYVNILISWLQYNEEPGRIIDEVVYEINFEKILLKQKYKFLDYCVRNTTNRNDIGNLYDHIIGKLQEEDYCVMDENDSKST